MEVHRVGLDNEWVVPLLAALEQEYQTRYGANDELKRTDAAEFDPPDGLFVVVRDGDRTVAGGGYRRHGPDVCEVKRMWTDPDRRRAGLAGLVLSTLETEAAASGYRQLVLETGPRQPEAVALYTARGYRPITAFGPYPEAVAFAFDL